MKMCLKCKTITLDESPTVSKLWFKFFRLINNKNGFKIEIIIIAKTSFWIIFWRYWKKNRIYNYRNEWNHKRIYDLSMSY